MSIKTKSKNGDGINRKLSAQSLAGKTKPSKNIKFPDIPKPKSYTILTRFVVIIAVAIVVYYAAPKRERKFATQKERIIERFQSITCSEAYLKEIEHFPKCVPNKCGRFVTDNLVNDADVNVLLSLAKAGFELGTSSGGASIMDLHSGALSQGEHFINMYQLKDAKTLLTPYALKVYQDIKIKIINIISQQFGIDSNSIYLTKPTFFSRITNQLAKTIHDEYWHPHVDKETYPSFHYTSLLYLSDYKNDFTGGRFIFIDKDNKTAAIEPKRGRISIFTSGNENVHYVEKVESGTRFAITISFTCDTEYAISNPTIVNEEHLMDEL